MQQGTEEWFKARAGKITTSRIADVMAFSKKDGKPLKARQDYVGDIVAEILTGQPREQIKAKALDWGTDVESAARSAYEAETGEIVTLQGFILHPTIEYLGSSPDGFVNSDGQMQVKCPANPVNHINTLTNGMPEEHTPQVQGELLVSERKWSDFVSFDPRMPPHLRLYIQRIYRDENYISEIVKACESLWNEVQFYLDQLNKRAA